MSSIVLLEGINNKARGMKVRPSFLLIICNTLNFWEVQINGRLDNRMNWALAYHVNNISLSFSKYFLFGNLENYSSG